MGLIKSFVRSAIRAAGYDVHRLTPGRVPYFDMRDLVFSKRDVTIFDVGANMGHTIEQFRQTFPQPAIHAFEPSRDTYNALREKCSRLPGVQINNIALGSRTETMEFIENTNPDMSSFLEPDEECWGAIKQRINVDVTTIDNYCRDYGIERIDILKSDTQGSISKS
jgi:FkbM family methyltransferase